MQQLFSALSGAVIIATLFIYVKQVANSSSTPNPATWFITLLAIVANAATYYFVVNRNIWLMINPSIISFGILIILLYAIAKGRIGKVGWVEAITFLATLIIGVVWKMTEDSITANLLMQIILLSSFAPTVIRLARGESKEGALAWSIAVLSYTFQIASVLSGQEWNWRQLAYPIANGIIGNGSVALLAFARRNRM